MTEPPLVQVRAGRVGRPHGLDGSFHLDAAAEPLARGTEVTVAGRPALVERVAGTASRPLVRLRDVDTREAAERLRGEWLLVAQSRSSLDDGEYFAADLVGCAVPGLGTVRRVVAAPSCDLLELEPDGTLIPFVRDAVRRVDPAARTIEVDRAFLGL